MINDYISREDALKGKNIGTFTNGIFLVAKPCVTVDYIESIKSADVALVRHARWRHYEGMYACEDCGAQLDDESPFCPMCGAKMDGGCREE